MTTTELNITPSHARALVNNCPAIAEIIEERYDETDRIDDIFVEDGDLFVSVNRGNVGSGTIQERFSMPVPVAASVKNLNL